MLAVQLPGRDERLNEPASDDMANVVEALVEALAARLRGPWAVVAFSMGTWIAHAVLEKLQNYPELPRPCLAILACLPPPHTAVSERHWPCVHAAPDREFQAGLRAWGVREAAFNPRVWPVLAPALRADFTLFERHHSRPTRRPLPCPLVGYWATADKMAPEADVRRWTSLAPAGAVFRPVRGPHLFLLDQASREVWFRELCTEILPGVFLP
jgi:surfactin synthase thioesterase subunit